MTKQKTIGNNINELVERYGGTTVGLYILAAALKKACKPDTQVSTVKIDDILFQETPGYVDAEQRQEELLAKLRAEEIVVR